MVVRCPIQVTGANGYDWSLQLFLDYLPLHEQNTPPLRSPPSKTGWLVLSLVIDACTTELNASGREERGFPYREATCVH